MSVSIGPTGSGSLTSTFAGGLGQFSPATSVGSPTSLGDGDNQPSFSNQMSAPFYSAETTRRMPGKASAPTDPSTGPKIWGMTPLQFVSAMLGSVAVGLGVTLAIYGGVRIRGKSISRSPEIDGTSCNSSINTIKSQTENVELIHAGSQSGLATRNGQAVASETIPLASAVDSLPPTPAPHPEVDAPHKSPDTGSDRPEPLAPEVIEARLKKARDYIRDFLHRI